MKVRKPMSIFPSTNTTLSNEFTIYSAFPFDQVCTILKEETSKNIWSSKKPTYLRAPKFIGKIYPTNFHILCKQYSNSVTCLTIGKKDQNDNHIIHVTQSLTYGIKLFIYISFFFCFVISLLTIIASIALIHQGGLLYLISLFFPCIVYLISKKVLQYMFSSEARLIKNFLVDKLHATIIPLPTNEI